MMAHVKASGHKLCDCGGDHFPHREGSPCCHSNPMSALHAAARAGATAEELEDIFFDIVLTSPKRTALDLSHIHPPGDR